MSESIPLKTYTITEITLKLAFSSKIYQSTEKGFIFCKRKTGGDYSAIGVGWTN